MPDNTDDIKRAFFKKQGDPDTKKVAVHFNPDSLQYVISNKLDNKGSGNSTKQYVSESTGKLTMDVVFDTTDSGEDVRLQTVKVAKFMEPDSEKVPPIIVFEWGLYSFTGMLEAYKEIIDFFSSDGVPLRASLNLTLSSQDKVFDGGSGDKKSNTGGGLDSPTSIPVNAPPGTGATGLATQGGNPNAARDIAAANGAESMRFPGEGAMELDASIELKGPELFASGGLSLGAGIGLDGGAGLGAGLDGGLNAGIGIDAGVGFDAGASLNIGASADINLSAGIGGNLSAGVSASSGAFGNLRLPSPSSSGGKLNLNAFIDSDITAGIGLESGAAIGIGGAAALQGSASMKTDVGKPGDLKARIEFSGG